MSFAEDAEGNVEAEEVSAEGDVDVVQVPETVEISTVNGEAIADSFADLVEVAGDVMEGCNLFNVDVSISVGPMEFRASLYREAGE